MSHSVADLERVPCRLIGYAPDPGVAVVEILRLDGPARLKRAATHLALCWGGALAGAFIPVAHLVLVPGLTIAGVVAAARDLKSDRIITGARGTCPDCGTEQALDLSGRWRGTAETSCGSCRRMLAVRR